MSGEARLERLYRSALETIEHLKGRLERAERRNAELEADGRRWAMERIQQQQIIQRQLDHSNAVSREYLEENKLLKEEIRRLKG